MSTSPITPPPSTGATTSTGTSGLPSGQSLNNMFLQLLVAQLQNQDPTDPVDPSQFVGQLAQFSELSEVSSIYTLLQSVIPAGGTASAGGTPATGSGSSTPASANFAPANPAANAAAASTPVTPLPSFATPSLSALTNQIKGVF
jgi:flagellar basal-body rod modification protein FlgD